MQKEIISYKGKFLFKGKNKYITGGTDNFLDIKNKFSDSFIIFMQTIVFNQINSDNLFTISSPSSTTYNNWAFIFIGVICKITLDCIPLHQVQCQTWSIVHQIPHQLKNIGEYFVWKKYVN